MRWRRLSHAVACSDIAGAHSEAPPRLPPRWITGRVHQDQFRTRIMPELIPVVLGANSGHHQIQEHAIRVELA